ncbi:MAG: hypothetical protein AAF456_14280, partial [Planctomycetota bacterium]
DSAIVWTKPVDWSFDPDNPSRGLGGHIANRIHTAFADGSARTFEADELRVEMFTSDAGDIFSDN